MIKKPAAEGLEQVTAFLNAMAAQQVAAPRVGQSVSTLWLVTWVQWEAFSYLKELVNTNAKGHNSALILHNGIMQPTYPLDIETSLTV